MRSYRYLLLVLAIHLGLDVVIAAPSRHTNLRRQDEQPSQRSQHSSTTPSPSSRPASTTSPRQAMTTNMEPASATEDAPSSYSVFLSTSAVSEASTITSSLSYQPSSSSRAEAGPAHILPIQPRLTPAIGLTGVILLLSGAVYALIGIKNQWLYVFAGAAYSTGLAVTVLIIYLMNPPVSDAVQGAFFVAATISGLIFGGVALVFSDITEGIGCLLGGFCISMWFLTLKADGLITSTSGRAIFIGTMSLSAFAFSWSHYTRNYALIVSTSFSGSTISMLGVDCLSRAGWKEFWLYLSNLNSDVFPLNTNSYPMTKGIKVELVGVVILGVLGIVAQMRLWKVINARREQNKAQRDEKRLAREREDEEHGRRLETGLQQERVRWEAAYGNKGLPEESSAESSTLAEAASIVEERELSSASVELCSLSPKQAQILVTELRNDSEDTIAFEDASLNQAKPIPHNIGSPMRLQSPRPLSEVRESKRVSRSVSSRSILLPSISPPSEAPMEKDAELITSESASTSAVPVIEEEPIAAQQSLPARLSTTSAVKRVSACGSLDPNVAETVLVISHTEDDQASSIAAALDDADELSVSGLSQGSGFKAKLTDSEHIDLDSKVTQGQRMGPNDSQIDDRKTSQDTEYSSQSSSSNEQHKSGRNSLQVTLPAQHSRINQASRTDQWTKHLEEAENPILNEEHGLQSPGIKIVCEPAASPSEEVTRPRITAKQDSDTKTPRVSQIELQKPLATPSDLTAGRVSRPKSQNLKIARGSSATLPSVIEPAGSRPSSGLTPCPENTLMNQRDARLRNRLSSHSFVNFSSHPTNEAEEDMTLAQRKRSLQGKHQKPAPASQTRRTSRGSWTAGKPIQEFDSHQPKRANAGGAEDKREALLADWRQSMRSLRAASASDEQRHAALGAKRQQEMERHQQALVTQRRESWRQSMMRSDEMMDAHREAMRRLQSAANKSVI